MGLFLKAGSFLIPIDSIKEVDIFYIEQGYITVKTADSSYIISGFDAFEAVMLLKPSALEGKKLRWEKNKWAFHNLIAHPLLQLMVWFGFTKQGIKLHDSTTPKPIGFRNEIK